MAEKLLSPKSIEAAIRAAKASGKSTMLADGAGLWLEVQPTGKGWWRQRFTFAGKPNRLSVGAYPKVSLAIARERAAEIVAQVAAGIDPAKARKDAKAGRAEDAALAALRATGAPLPGTFEHVAREWLAGPQASKVSPGHVETTQRRLERDAFPYLGARPIGEITARELLECLRRIEARGTADTAHRVKFCAGQVFRYGISIGACASNPAGDLRDALKSRAGGHFSAVTNPQEAAALLHAMDGYKGHPITRAALQLSSLLMLRPGELRQLRWTWIDLDDALVTVPAEVMKRDLKGKANGQPHLVPLATQAVAILRELHPLTGKRPFVFPSLTSPGTRCMSENTVRSALRRLGFDNETMTAHGFRAMARTMLAERLNFDPEVIEAQLAHKVAGPLGRAYNRAQFVEQRRAMLERWADYLEELRRAHPAVDALAPQRDAA